MLQVEIITAETQRLQISFDSPATAVVRDHAEFRGFWDHLSRCQGFEASEDQGTVLGFSLPLVEWMGSVREFFPEQDSFQQVIFEKFLALDIVPASKQMEINFHQRQFDSPERSWLFILNQGHFFQYVLNRIYWHLGPKHGLVSPFPLHVDIETANTCNMNCPMCFHDKMESVGQMDFELFKKLIDECEREHVFSVRLSWRGEPLTHPRIKEFIAYATARIPNVSFLTNAFFLEDAVLDCIIENGLSYLAVSFDGVEQAYEKIRRPAVFAESRQRLANLRTKREAAGTTLPQVRVCTIWPAIKHDPDQYCRLMAPVSDYMVYNPYIDFFGEMHIKDGFVCQYPWERIMVAWNGEVQCCTGWNAKDIVLGNAAEGSIKEFWLSERLDVIRELHATGRRMELKGCAECRHGCECDPTIELDTILERAK